MSKQVRQLHEMQPKDLGKRELPIGNQRRWVQSLDQYRFLSVMNSEPQSASVKRVGTLIVLLQEADDLRCKIWAAVQGHEAGYYKNPNVPRVLVGMLLNLIL